MDIKDPLKGIDLEKEYMKWSDKYYPDGMKLDPNRPRLDDSFLVVVRFDNINSYYKFLESDSSFHKYKCYEEYTMMSDGDYFYLGFMVDDIEKVKPHIQNDDKIKFSFDALCELGIKKSETIDFFYDNIKSS